VTGVACRICGCATAPLAIDKTGELYHTCPDCEFIYLDPAHHLSPEEEKGRYELHENSIENDGYVKMLQSFIDRAVTPWAGEARTALEFGCGPGPVLKVLLERMGFVVDVYDPHFAPDKVYEGKQYDLITSTEVVEHLSDPLPVLALLRDHLAPGGTLALMTQFHANNPAHFQNWHYRREPTHIAFFTHQTFDVIAEALGLEILWRDDKDTVVLTM
jgi:SAM-dependent methyltransferase